MVCLGLQKETLGLLKASVLVVSLPEPCAHPTVPGASQEHPSSGTGQELPLSGCCPIFPSGLIALVCRELLMQMQMLQRAGYPQRVAQTHLPRGAQQLLHEALKIRARKETKRGAPTHTKAL